ncbi:MAG TPA: MmgE/PrpD family protein [Anaerolineales bacterium]|nr:MmgE/PrpD family protein [Anaerolineales bacterium]
MIAEQMAAFISRANWGQISQEGREALKIRVLDSLACALGAVEGEPILILRKQIDDFGGKARCTLIGGGKTAPDRAAFFNSALVRYLDFSDSYLAKGETCHPSDNLGAILAAGEYAAASGKELLTALGVAYQVQCRLSDVAPVRDRGFDHVTQQAFSATAGACKILDLDKEHTANALAIAGTAYNALRVTRTGELSHWKGLAAPNTARNGLHAAFMGMNGITGPPAVFEGNKGWMETISGPWELNWGKEDLERVRWTVIKKYNAEIHSQSAIEAALDLKHEHELRPEEIKSIRIDIFDVAYKIIGGGEEGDKTIVRTKEEADHSLQYMVSVALLDDQVLPAQYAPERIEREDVQNLLRQVTVRPEQSYSERFPGEMACKVTITTRDGKEFIQEKRDYEGFFTRPASWETVENKFRFLSAPYAAKDLQQKIIEVVRGLEEAEVRDLTRLLADPRGFK